MILVEIEIYLTAREAASANLEGGQLVHLRERTDTRAPSSDVASALRPRRTPFLHNRQNAAEFGVSKQPGVPRVRLAKDPASKADEGAADGSLECVRSGKASTKAPPRDGPAQPRPARGNSG